MDDERTAYMAFLLRLWLEDGGDAEAPDRLPGEWRASLQDPHTQALQVFATLEALFEFLQRETARRALGENARQPEAGRASHAAPFPGA